jgi:hypothetical protein
MTLPRLVSLLALWLVLLPAAAQDRLLSPSEFLGHQLGERFTMHHQVVAYVQHVGQASPLVRVEQYGTSYEGRPLVVAFIARPDRLGRLDEVRRDNLRLAGLESGSASADAPAIVWLAYNIHGNESVSTEAAMQTLFKLADPANARTQAWLENTVVVLDPVMNPDGRERYVQWYNRTVGRFPDFNPEAREHHEPWPGGRSNHYYFDLNRDWAWQTQQESRYRTALYRQWLPHVHVDFHEQGVDDPYYFAPAAEPIHDRITGWQREFQHTIGMNHARYFDADGRLFFTRERFDLFYPSYGDTWPTFQGAIGMTYEQGGSGRAGLGIETAEGDTLTLAMRIRNHHETGLSTVEVTSRHSDRVVREFRGYFEESRQRPRGPYAAIVVKEGPRQEALAEYLRSQDIEVGYATRGRNVRGFSFQTGTTGSVSVEPGDLVVSAFQPKSVLMKVLMEPRTTVVDSVTYDITAWSLPYAYGLEAYALTERLEPDAPTFARSRNVPAGPMRPYAYVLPWERTYDVAILGALLRENIRVRSASRPFTVDGVSYAPGALTVTRAGNERHGDRLDDLVRRIASENGREAHPVASGFVADGFDFGSRTITHLGRTRIGVLSGDGTSSLAVGEVWHYFDQQIGYPVTMLDVSTLGRVDLSNYDVLVLPAGSYADALPDRRLEQVRDWVRAGGRLVALESAARFLAGKEGFGLKRREADEDTLQTADRLRRFENREREAISGTVAGAIFTVQIDNSHPLGYGLPERYHTLKRGTDAFEYLESGWNVGALRSGVPVAGFAGYRAQENLGESLVFGVQEMGRGSVIYLADNPLFRLLQSCIRLKSCKLLPRR